MVSRPFSEGSAGRIGRLLIACAIKPRKKFDRSWISLPVFADMAPNKFGGRRQAADRLVRMGGDVDWRMNREVSHEGATRKFPQLFPETCPAIYASAGSFCGVSPVDCAVLFASFRSSAQSVAAGASQPARCSPEVLGPVDACADRRSGVTRILLRNRRIVARPVSHGAGWARTEFLRGSSSVQRKP
jgi:hypothetical protein